MKEFTAKTVEEAVSAAATALGVDALHLVYEVKEEKKGLFKKSATIAVYEDSDASDYAEKYLKSALAALGVDIETDSVVEDGIIKLPTKLSELENDIIGVDTRQHMIYLVARDESIQV